MADDNSRFIPPVSNKAYKGLSEHRRATLANEISSGTSGTRAVQEQDKLTAMSNASSSVGLNKAGQLSSGSGGQGGQPWAGRSDTYRQIDPIYSPLWLNSNLNLPRDRASVNAWSRSFYALQPPIFNAINLHSTYPIGKLNIKCSNKKIEQFFSEQIEQIDLLNICTQVAQEYWLLGEAFISAELDQNKMMWSRLVLQNPDYISVQRSAMASEPIISLRPDERLRQLVFSNRPSDIEQRNQINPAIIEHVKRGENIPLDPFFTSSISRKISPYEARGTGLPVACFRQLMLFDLIRECKYAQANNMINPITVVKVGGEGPDALHPTSADLEQWRELFAQAQFDRDFKIFTHAGLTIEKIGSGQGIYDTSGDITQLLSEIYTAMMIPKVIVDGGSDVSYANGGISLDVLRDRYISFRTLLSSWLRNKIFAPISKLNEFYEYIDGTKKLIVPTIEWNHMSLFDTYDYINILVQLQGQGEPSAKKVSTHTLYRSLGLEYEEEQMRIRKEAIAEEIRKKEAASLARMPLNELRALGEDDDIPEIVESVEMENSPYSDAGQAAPGAGGGLGDSLPPLPGLSSPSPAPEAVGGLPPSLK